MNNITNQISLASIFQFSGQKRVCVGMCWDGIGKLDHVEFYDPVADVINECSAAELEKYLSNGTMTIYSPPKGRMLNPKPKWKK